MSDCLHVFSGPGCLVCGIRSPHPTIPPRMLDPMTTWHTWSRGRLVPLSEPWRHVGTIMYEPGHVVWVNGDFSYAHHYLPPGVP